MPRSDKTAAPEQVALGFDFLRVSIEAQLQFPTILTVTSAMDDDGTALVATGLAHAFARTGRTTLLVTDRALREQAAGGARTMTSDIFAHATGDRSELTLAFAALREQFAIVLVDAEPIVDSAAAYEIASASDGVILTVRLGRKPAPRDKTVVDLLDTCGSRILGVVPTRGSGSDSRVLRTAGAEHDLPKIRAKSIEAAR